MARASTITAQGGYVAGVDNHGSLTSIDYEHHEIHDGNHYRASHYNDTVADDADLNLFIKVGANKELHMVLSVSASGSGEIYVFEATTVSGDGTGLEEVNSNRTSANVSDATVFHTPTITGDGNEKWVEWLAGGVGPRPVGGQIQGRAEWILDKSTNYMLRFTNRSGGNASVSLNAAWYED